MTIAERFTIPRGCKGSSLLHYLAVDALFALIVRDLIFGSKFIPGLYAASFLVFVRLYIGMDMFMWGKNGAYM